MRSKKWSVYVHPEGEPYPIMDSIVFIHHSFLKHLVKGIFPIGGDNVQSRHP